MVQDAMSIIEAERSEFDEDAVPQHAEGARQPSSVDLDEADQAGNGEREQRAGVYPRIAKPLFDRATAAVLLVITAVPMMLVAFAVAVSMGRPILFRQRRVGQNGTIFEVLKFRTMLPDRRSHELDVIHDRRQTHKSDDDPRHTAVGRFLRRTSLDELPQLVNVLRGQMSIVGPRPELESVVERYDDERLHHRHEVRPGLTGLWQVVARGGGPMHENGQWDLEYVERISLRTDLSILVRTPTAILRSGPAPQMETEQRPVIAPRKVVRTAS